MHRVAVAPYTAKGHAPATKRGMLQAADAALAELDSLARNRTAARDVLDVGRAEYEARIRDTEAALRETRLARDERRAEELTRTRRHLLLVETITAITMCIRGVLAPLRRQVLPPRSARRAGAMPGMRYPRMTRMAPVPGIPAGNVPGL